MSTILEKTVEPDGTLRYTCNNDVVIRVQLHLRNGTKRCPVELLHQGISIIFTETNLRELRDIESLLKHATTRCEEAGVKVQWHSILTDVAAKLPEKVAATWEPVSQPLSAYTAERKDYLWYPLIPQGEPMSIEGDPGAGKSALLVKLFCHLTTGTRFPTLFNDRPERNFAARNVVLYTAEDDPSSTVLPRVLINEGDPSRVHILEGKRQPNSKEILPLTLQDLGAIEALLIQLSPAVMAFDPLQSFFGPDVDMNHATDTRPVLDAVRHLCKSHGCTPLYVRHNGKSQRSKAIHAALGSIDITAHMRSVLTLYKDPDILTRRILAHTKTNGRYGPSMQFNLVGVPHEILVDCEDGEERLMLEDVRVDWDGLSDLTADDLNARETVHGNDNAEASSALDQAREFLRDILREGPVLVEEINKEAKKAGLTSRTLRRAKDKENVKARRQEQDGIAHAKQPWTWGLPDTETWTSSK